MIGIPLRIQNQKDAYNVKEQMWIFQLKMENDFSFKLADEYLEETSPRRTLLNCLWNLYAYIRFEAPPNEIDIIFNELIHFFPREQWISAIQNCCLCGNYVFRKSGPLICLEYYEKALQIWLEYVDDDELNCYIDIAGIYISMSKIYRYPLENIEMVKKTQNLAITYSELALKKANIDYEKMIIHASLSEMYLTNMHVSRDDTKTTENCLLHIKHKELEIEHRLKCRQCSEDDFQMDVDGSISHPTIANLYLLLGHRYLSICKYSEALATFDKALALYLTNCQGGNCLKMIGFIPVMVRTCITINDYNAALKYKVIAHEGRLKYYYGTDNSLDKEKIVDSYVELSDIYMKLHQYHLAAENLQIAITKYKEIRADRSTRIVELQNKMHDIQSCLSTPDT